MSPVLCPECGAVMVLRTARRGPNRGNQFYGCSRYPACRATRTVQDVPADPAADEEDEPLQPEIPEGFAMRPGAPFPRALTARACFPNYQVRFLETAALPGELLERLSMERVDEAVLRAFSQWRLDFPLNPSSPNLNVVERQVLSIVEKILTRGRITLLAPVLEEEIRHICNNACVGDMPLPDALAALPPQPALPFTWFDSREESVFYNDLLRELLGGNYQCYALPQVEIPSLLSASVQPDPTAPQRVDFALFHPAVSERVVVEIDGKQHLDHVEADARRDDSLQREGYRIIRIPAEQVADGGARILPDLRAQLAEFIRACESGLRYETSSTSHFVHAVRIAHQIQITLLQAIQSAFLDLRTLGSWRIETDVEPLGIFNAPDALAILQGSVSAFCDLLRRVCGLYSVDLPGGDPVCSVAPSSEPQAAGDAIRIAFANTPSAAIPTFYISRIYFPHHIAHATYSVMQGHPGPADIREEDLTFFLKYLFRKPCFWEGQFEGILRALRGQDALLLLPTGAGKSLVYQLASFLLPGRTIVIDPIISLMDDQIDNLAMIGIDRCIAITSQIEDPEERSRAIALFAQGEYLFAFVAPERFQTTEFRESLRTLTVHTPVSLIVVDEAHCVSEWGHDFRTAYLNIGRSTREFCQSNGIVPPFLAMTGTASRSVLKDVQRELQIRDFDAIITPKTFDRRELHYFVIHSSSQEKQSRLIGILGQRLAGLFNVTAASFFQTRGSETFCGLVFCPNVNGPFGVVQVADEVRRTLGAMTAYYSGREPRGVAADEHRRQKRLVASAFKRNRIPLLICTKAFGMGIDKPNIRYTIHYGIPGSIESFYQEAGRAGRNRKDAWCCLIVSNDDPDRARRLLDPNTAVEEIVTVVKSVSWAEKDDITRMLYFHVDAFRGINREREDVEKVLAALGDISRRATRPICLRGVERTVVEKALHRLTLIGLISDYTIDYANQEFTAKLTGATPEQMIETYGNYVAGYLHSRRQTEVQKATGFLNLTPLEFVNALVDLAIRFVYDVIERGRRRALQEMLLASSDASDDGMRARILRYLEATEYSEAIVRMVADADAGIGMLLDIFAAVRSPNDAAELRGQAARYLESYPDHPGLLMLRALSEAFCGNPNREVARQNLAAACSAAREKYGIRDPILWQAAAWAIATVGEHDPELARLMMADILGTHPERPVGRALVEQSPFCLKYFPARWLLRGLQSRCQSLIATTGGKDGR